MCDRGGGGGYRITRITTRGTKISFIKYMQLEYFAWKTNVQNSIIHRNPEIAENCTIHPKAGLIYMLVALTFMRCLGWLL